MNEESRSKSAMLTMLVGTGCVRVQSHNSSVRKRLVGPYTIIFGDGAAGYFNFSPVQVATNSGKFRT